MKLSCAWPLLGTRPSLPVRGAWIEIPILQPLYNMIKSLPVRGAWIEISLLCRLSAPDTSLPVRGAWIEILPTIVSLAKAHVAPRKGSVD